MVVFFVGGVKHISERKMQSSGRREQSKQQQQQQQQQQSPKRGNGPLSPILKYLFLLEALINLCYAGPAMMFWPQSMVWPVLGLLVTEETGTTNPLLLPIVLELIRWFGIFVLTFGGLLLGWAVWYFTDHHDLLVVLQVFVVSDVLYTTRVWLWIHHLAQWHQPIPFELYGNGIFSTILFVARMIAINQHSQPNIVTLQRISHHERQE